jgi:acyl-CoA dehydrogenase
MRFDDEQAMILKSVREFCRKKSPIASVRDQMKTETGFDMKIWKEMVELGWPGMSFPEEFGGFGLGIGAVVSIVESMGRYMLSTPFLSTLLAGQVLLRAGTADQKKTWLPKIANGAIGAAALLDNEDWGSDFMSCAASEQGDKLALRGAKWLVSDAGASKFFIVPARFRKAPALILISRDQLPANAVKRQTLIDETKRCFKVDFTGAVVEKTALLDSEKTVSALRDLELIGALLCAAEAVGSAAAALDLTVAYLKNRKQFGKFIGSYQALKHPTVDVLNEMEAARSLIYHAATIVSDGPLDKDMEIACRMAKAQATNALGFAADRAVQFHGGMGFTYECDAQLYLRRAQWSQQQFGDAYHHRKRLAPLLLD